MADFDLDVLILSEHEAFRRSFAELDGLTAPVELDERWTGLAEGLEVHASGEEQLFYPQLLQATTDSAADTAHAVGDHNEIRDAVRAVAEHETASPSWWEAVAHAREVTADHLGEEERDVLPAFRDSVDDEQRSALGMQWLQFHEEHERARGLSGEDEDPQQFVREHG